jgi:hypothetical protein
MSEKSAQDTTRASVLDELVFVGRSGPADRRGALVRPTYGPVLDDPEPAEPLTAGLLVVRCTVLTLLAAAIILVIGLGIGYAA